MDRHYHWSHFITRDSNHHQLPLENLGTLDRDGRTTRRYLQYIAVLWFDAYMADYLYVDPIINANVCSSASQCSHAIASHMWLSIRHPMHIYP